MIAVLTRAEEAADGVGTIGVFSTRPDFIGVVFINGTFIQIFTQMTRVEAKTFKRKGRKNNEVMNSAGVDGENRKQNYLALQLKRDNLTHRHKLPQANENPVGILAHLRIGPPPRRQEQLKNRRQSARQHSKSAQLQRLSSH